MATVRKFMFDLDFDDPDAVARAENPPEPEPEEPEVVEPEIIVPTFSEEEMAAARKAGYDEGFEAGRKKAAEATEEKLLASVEETVRQLGEIYNGQHDANSQIAKEMVSVACAIARKMFPDLNARNALGEVERVVQETLSAITEEPRVQIMLPPDLREPFMERLSAMTNRAGFDGKVFVNPDASLNPGDCRIEWSNGAAVRDSDALWEMIDDIVKRNIHGDDDDAGESHGDDTAQAHAEAAPAARPAPKPDAAAPTPEAASAPVAPEPDASEEMLSDQSVETDMTADGDAFGDAETDAEDDDVTRPAGATSVDPLSPGMQAAILDADSDDVSDADGDGEILTPEQET